MNDMPRKAQIRQFIVENFLYGDSGVTFADGDSLLDQGLIDSTGILELVMFLEETYGVSVEDVELVPENLDSVQAIDNFVAGKL